MAPELTTKAMRTYAAPSSLRANRELKQGGDIVNGGRYGWFADHAFSDNLSPSLFDRVPKRSETGKRLFGFGPWLQHG